MRRVLVVGSPGAGKSTLSARLAEELGVPVHYLDRHHWLPGWKYRDTASAREIVGALADTPEWVMDGNFAETFDLRIPRADALVWLDYPRSTCVRRILTRTVKHYGKQKPDLPEGCLEQFDAKLLRWVWNFPLEQRPQIVAGIERYGGHLHVTHIKSDRDACDFLAMVKAA